MRFALGWAVIGAAYALPVQADAAWEWLARMNDAVRTQTYTGTAVVQNADRLETLRIAHRFRDDREEERVVSLSGEMREVIRADGEVHVVLPDQGIRIIEADPGRGLLPVLGEAARQQLSQHYALRLAAETSRVAERSVRMLQITPRDDWRWGYRILLDEATGMPLELSIVTPTEAVLERMQFVEIQFHDMLADNLVQLDPQAVALQVIRTVKANARSGLRTLGEWEVTDAPPGFRLTARNWTQLPGAEKPVAHWVFSDGLASVSIYASIPSAATPLTENPGTSGAVSAARRLHGSVLITAMGEVPARTAQRFSVALQPLQP